VIKSNVSDVEFERPFLTNLRSAIGNWERLELADGRNWPARTESQLPARLQPFSKMGRKSLPWKVSYFKVFPKKIITDTNLAW